MAFQVIKVEQHCEHEIFTTNEGLYLIDASQASKFRRSKLSLKDVQDLTLSYSDYKTLLQSRITDKLQKYICHTFINNLKVFSVNNEYIQFRDLQGNSLILYSDNGQLYIPHCVYVKEIDIVTATKNCFKDVPIKFQINNKTIFAFLQKDNIIKRHSKLVNCQHVQKSLTVGNSNLVITRNGSNNLVQKGKSTHKEPLNIINTPLYDLNFHHMHEIVEGVDVIDEIKRYLHVPEAQGDFVVLSDTIVNKKNVMVEPLNKAKETYEYVKTEVKNIAFGTLNYLQLIIIILIILFLISLAIYFRKNIFILFMRMKLKITKTIR